MQEFWMPGLLFRWLAKGPATRRYPSVRRAPFPATRGSIAIDAPRCTLCTLCQKRCPTDAIVVSRQDKTWSIDRLHCTACRACVECCPVKCLSMLPAYTDPPFKKSVEVFHRPDPVKTPPAVAPETAPGGAPEAAPHA